MEWMAFASRSPILDIKPYVPFCDAIGDASQPEWVTRDREVEEEPLHVSRVSISQEPWNRLRECWQRVGGEASLYEDFGTLVDLVRQVLSRDIRSLHQRGALALTAKTGSANHGKRPLGTGVEGSAANAAATAAATVYHLHLLGRIDISYVHERKEIEVIDATIV
uniref:TsaA-like domain-containing protein n=1 Tax=Chloropicon laureae TaxID=464258 RepID=A0A7S2Z840_9CHLO|mmetsp:Transcript_9411/g.24086  ORF Transcript_9411/g.24086 Transcript_9411/m.24086 type:complete len:165 (-) Transcript_9411:66-560(-)